MPGPDSPVQPAPVVCFDSPDADAYRLDHGKRFSLLPPLEVIVTGYSSTADQTDSTPFLTATMTSVRPGVIALSRDLIQRYNPEAPFRYGDRVIVEGIGVFVVEDTMNKRYERRADIWFPTRDEAKQWGKKQLSLTPAGDGDGIVNGSVRREASTL